MTCKHQTEHTRWEKVYNTWTGEYEDELVTTTTHHTRDIGIGAYQCMQCNEVMYYTGSWKKHYTEGTPCPSSDIAERTGDTARVRAVIGTKK
jgi:hypothetical protein